MQRVRDKNWKFRPCVAIILVNHRLGGRKHTDEKDDDDLTRGDFYKENCNEQGNDSRGGHEWWVKAKIVEYVSHNYDNYNGGDTDYNDNREIRMKAALKPYVRHFVFPPAIG